MAAADTAVRGGIFRINRGFTISLREAVRQAIGFSPIGDDKRICFHKAFAIVSALGARFTQLLKT